MTFLTNNKNFVEKYLMLHKNRILKKTKNCCHNKMLEFKNDSQHRDDNNIVFVVEKYLMLHKKRILEKKKKLFLQQNVRIKKL